MGHVVVRAAAPRVIRKKHDPVFRIGRQTRRQMTEPAGIHVVAEQKSHIFSPLRLGARAPRIMRRFGFFFQRFCAPSGPRFPGRCEQTPPRSRGPVTGQRLFGNAGVLPGGAARTGAGRHSQTGPTPAPRLRPGRMRARSSARAFGAPRPGNRTPGRRLNAARPEPECAETPRADGIYADIYEGDIRPRAVFAPRKTLRGAGRQRARLSAQKPTAPEPECRSGRRKQG